MADLPTILLYNTFFGESVDISRLVESARVAYVFDKSMIYLADAVVFHIPDMVFDAKSVAEFMKLEKPLEQVWIAWSMESGQNYPIQNDSVIMSRFDLTMGFKRSSDIWAPYCPPAPAWEAARAQPLPPKTERSPLVMFQSATFNKSLRTEFASQLFKHICVDSYGRHLNNRTLMSKDMGRDTKLATIKKYKFCLSLENAIEEDYVTEKFFDPLLAGVVPVYRGAPNVSDFAPGDHCFIDALEFSSPRDLAAYLNYLVNDEAAYAEYFKWRSLPLAPEFESGIIRRMYEPFEKLVELIAAIKEFRES